MAFHCGTLTYCLHQKLLHVSTSESHCVIFCCQIALHFFEKWVNILPFQKDRLTYENLLRQLNIIETLENRRGKIRGHLLRHEKIISNNKKRFKSSFIGKT